MENVIRGKGMVGILLMLLVALLLPGQPAEAAAGDWPTYMMNNAHTGFNGSETILNRTTVNKMKVHWQVHTAPISSQPVVANGVVYWGSWDGYEHATNLSGQQLWQTYLGKTTPPANCMPPSAGVAGSATVTTALIGGVMVPVVLVSGGDAHIYALNASDGHIIWSTALGTSPNYMLWAGPAAFNGSVYVGVASYGDCPLVPGRVVRLNIATGVIQNSFTTVPPGCIGGGVWMVPTIDEANHSLYVSTGTIAPCRTDEVMAYALVKLNTDNLSLQGYWRIPKNEWIGDGDFGSTPTLFSATIGGTLHQMVGLVNKNGIYYALDRANIAAGPVWQKKVSNAHNNIGASAWDGQTLYTPATLTVIRGMTCTGAIRAHDPATGTVKWEYCAPGKVIGALSVAGGVVFAGAGANQVAVDAATGKQLFVYKDMTKGATFWSGASVSNGMLYTGNGRGNFYAFGL